MRARISSARYRGRPVSAKRLASTAQPVSRRQVSVHVASIFVTPAGSDSIDSADVQQAQPKETCEYPKGYTLFKVKRGQKERVAKPNAPIEDIREEEFLSATKAGSHHISIYTTSLSESMDFYQKGLGFTLSPWRPKGLPYNGAWFNVSAVGKGENAMVHLIELPNPKDFSRCQDESCIVHFSIAIQPGTLEEFYKRMDAHGFSYAKSVNNRQAAVFCDPNGYRIEVIELPQTGATKGKRTTK